MRGVGLRYALIARGKSSRHRFGYFRSDRREREAKASQPHSIVIYNVMQRLCA